MEDHLNNVIESVKIKNVPTTWCETWEESMESFPGQIINFLEETFLRDANKTLKLPEDALKALIDMAAVIRSDINLCRLVWHCSHSVFYSHKQVDPITFFPDLDEYLGKISSLFQGIVLISGIEKVLGFYRERGIPQNIVIDTLGDFGLWMKHCYEKHGHWGIKEAIWCIYHFTGRIYRLGRLQFIWDTFQGDLLVFKNIQTQKIIALSAPGIKFRGDGQVDGTNHIFDPKGVWISQLEMDEKHVKGNLITPNGEAVPDFVTLSLDEWKQMLCKGDPVLDIHVPHDDRLCLDLCKESIQMANDFFPRYFAEKSFQAFTCNTWLFDAQYQKLLPPTSNIVKFQREFYLYPVLEDDKQTFERVFGEYPGDFSKVPRDTQLQRSVFEHITSGGQLHNAGGFILREDLHWVKAVYQGT